MIETKERFWSKVDIRSGDECWEWQAGTVLDGYGRFWLDGGDQFAHRVAYQLENGIIPMNVLVLHRCDNPPCVNPDHLFLGGHSENSTDAIAKKRRKPPRGERNGRSVLKTNDVEGIRKLYRQGRFTQRQLADSWGVSQNTIGCIVRYETWTHI